MPNEPRSSVYKIAMYALFAQTEEHTGRLLTEAEFESWLATMPPVQAARMRQDVHDYIEQRNRSCN